MPDEVAVTWHSHTVSRPRGCVVWFTGLSGSGKSTIANLVDAQLFEAAERSFVLDGDNIRHGLNAGPQLLRERHGDQFAERFGLGFSAQDRQENIRRIGEVSELFCAAGIITLTAFVSPYRRDRDAVRHLVESMGAAGDFVEVFVDAPLEVCQQRDPKGLYQKVAAGELRGMTGVDDPYEVPHDPELVLHSGSSGPEQLASRVIDYLRSISKLRSG